MRYETNQKSSLQTVLLRAKSLICVEMVQPAGLEPATSSFAGRRSNPTELWLHNNLMQGKYSENDQKSKSFIEDWNSRASNK